MMKTTANSDNMVLVNGGDAFQSGDRVILDGKHGGTVHYFGTVEDRSGIYVGIDLDEPNGRHNGTVGDKQYFTCTDKHGLFAPLARVKREPEFKPGDKVVLKKKQAGIVRFVGQTHFGHGLWIGVELRRAVGKNDGSVDGNRYFMCGPNHGIFSRARAFTHAITNPQTDGHRTSLNAALVSQRLGCAALEQYGSTSSIDTSDRLESTPRATPIHMEHTHHDDGEVKALQSENASLKLQLLEEQDRVRSLMQKQSLDEAGKFHKQLSEERQRVNEMMRLLDLAHEGLAQASARETDLHNRISEVMRQRDELAIKLEDLEMESDVLTAEKEVLEEDFNEASDRLEAVQMDLLDARTDMFDALHEAETLKVVNDAYERALKENNIDPLAYMDEEEPAPSDPLASVKSLLAELDRSGINVNHMNTSSGADVSSDEEDEEAEDEQRDRRILRFDDEDEDGGPQPHSDQDDTEEAQELDEQEDEQSMRDVELLASGSEDEDGDVEIANLSAQRPSPPPGVDASLFCDICEEYGHTADECDDTETF